ncbi:MAG: tRNA (N(6)-L-threonylcarbamoyladenosine(37)-C(2))-methylthiotransferase MtaB [Ruminococcus sp.]|nr:tRNA (N(6)-L-threonylcarbamoyladenosine(37)-C(2))-methylthiotransferase MtaB [Ruminococcus sp.]
MDFNILTLGCKVNQYESQAMREDLLRHGFTLSPDKDRADVTVINTCTVTSVSDAKNRKLINRVRRQNPDGIIVLTGCMPQAFPDEMQDFAACDIILGNKERAALVPAIRRFVAERTPMLDIPAYHNTGDVYENLTVSSFGEHTRAFIKIEDGCNRFCSYCIIPYARGRVRSKPLADLKREIGQVAASGYREVVLVGINLSAYGQGEDFDLADAVEAACAVEGIARVRLGSLEPEQMTEPLIARLAAQPKFCPQFHLSLQSGCNRTLKAMNRHYDSAEYMAIVDRLRAAFDNASVTTDVMVGFAGETGEDFQASLNFVKSVGFAKVHVFPYSQRKGTRAADAPDQVEPAEKERRAKVMGDLVEQSRRDFLTSQVGLTEEVLFERLRRGCLEGYTKNYTPVRVISDDSSLCGEVRQVRLVEVGKDCCMGEWIIE